MRIAAVTKKAISNPAQPTTSVGSDFDLLIGDGEKWYLADQIAGASGFPSPGCYPIDWIKAWNSIGSQIRFPEDISPYDLGEVKHWLPPVLKPQKVICIGLNYAEHAAETGASKPDIPVVFNKFPNTLIGHGESICLPELSQKVDFEAELVVVIGKEGKGISEETAMDHVFGFTCGHDVSARDWQKEKPGKQWLLGKTFDTFAPLGPSIVSKESVSDPNDLSIRFQLNGETMQDSSTKHFIFSIPFLISHISKFTTLMPGDLLFTGTPSGVGVARDPQVFLKPGDEAVVKIASIGELKNSIQ